MRAFLMAGLGAVGLALGLVTPKASADYWYGGYNYGSNYSTGSTWGYSSNPYGNAGYHTSYGASNSWGNNYGYGSNPYANWGGGSTWGSSNRWGSGSSYFGYPGNYRGN